MMIFINEWFPNPTGSDAKGEFVELWNNGDAPVDLSGWSLGTDIKKKFSLSGLIRANGYVVVRKGQTKLALKNTDGRLFLYDVAGKLVDQSAFEGSAPEGKSFSRVSYAHYGASSTYAGIQQFAWSGPTPGEKNSATLEAGISETDYPAGVFLNTPCLAWFSVLGLAAALGIIFAAVSWYAIKTNEDISQLFFGGNEAIRP
jgi:hypothetical protein